MNAYLGTQVMGSLLVSLTFASAVSAGGSLFVTHTQTEPIRRLDSQTFELLGDVPNSELLCCILDIDPYRRVIWAGEEIYSLDGSLLIDKDDGITHQSNIEPISNSFWDISGTLWRETYDQFTWERGRSRWSILVRKKSNRFWRKHSAINKNVTLMSQPDSFSVSRQHSHGDILFGLARAEKRAGPEPDMARQSRYRGRKIPAE